jgi:hypothetical protein
VTLVQQLNPFVIRNIERMSIHEFVTVSRFYLSQMHVPGICSKALATSLFAKIDDSITEFNELQLMLFKTAIEKTFVAEQSKYANQSLDQLESFMFQGDKEMLELMNETYEKIQV